MQKTNFPVLCFLLLAYWTGFAIIALVLALVAVMQYLLLRKRSLATSPNAGVNAQALAPIFEPQLLTPAPNQNTSKIPSPARSSKKPKRTLATLIREEAS